MANFGVVLDIDGVLYLGSHHDPIDGAKEAIELLVNGKFGPIPHIYVTNGTGKTEAGKAKQLEYFLHQQISPKQVIMASTPMQELSSIYSQQKVLIVSGDQQFSHEIGKLYGFQNITTIEEYLLKHQILYPHKTYPPYEQQPLETEEPITSIFLMQVPNDWAEGLQLCVDILRSTGVPLAKNEIDFSTQKQKVKLFCGNPDLDYAGLHSVPRLTLGAFLVCLKTLFFESVGHELEFELFGKPYALTYRYAEKALQEMTSQPLHRIYAIGDNPKSDIKGANEAGDKWVSVLVKTGCFQGEDNDITNPAKLIYQNVLEAIQNIFKLEEKYSSQL